MREREMNVNFKALKYTFKEKKPAIFFMKMLHGNHK